MSKTPPDAPYETILDDIAMVVEALAVDIFRGRCMPDLVEAWERLEQFVQQGHQLQLDLDDDDKTEVS